MIIDGAKRLLDTKEYYFSTKLREIRQLRDAGKKVINLGIGSPDLPPHPSITATLRSWSEKEDAHGYQSYQGIPAFRKAIHKYLMRYFEVPFDPESEILPLIGSKEGIMHISMAFLNKDDQVLVPNPGYPTYQAVANLAQVQTIKYQLSEDSNWDIDLEVLEQLPLDDIKLMWINYPHMPSGSLPNLTTLKHVVKLAKKHQFLIVNDNPYAMLFSGKPFSIFQIEGAREVALELHSMSKSHNMAGWRLGWVVGEKDYINCILKVKSNMDSGMFLPVQQAAINALSLPETYFEELRSIYKIRRTVASEIFDALQCTYSPQQEGMFHWAKIPDHIASSSVWVDSIIHQANVFIVPGSIFGEQASRYLRISLCSKEEHLREALGKVRGVKKW